MSFVAFREVSYFLILASTVVLYAVLLTIWRLFLHPLAGFPGPKLAAATGWYMAYYDLLRDGGLVERLQQLHSIHGPIVRIAPNELHFSDPRAYGHIYASGSKFLKHAPFYQCFGQEESSFAYTDPRLAKARRDVISPFFSRRAILQLENVVQNKVNLLVSQLLSHQSRDQPFNMYLAFRSTTLDVISSYCFAKSYDAITFPDFRHPFLISMENMITMPFVFKYFPWLSPILFSLPNLLTLRLNPSMRGFVDLRKSMEKQIDGFIANPSSLQTVDHETIYHHLMSPEAKKSGLSLPTRKALLEEGLNLMIAGSDTVGNACVLGTFHVLNSRAIYNRLVMELDSVWPDKDISVGLDVLEQLPYLTAVIKESLRLSSGVVTGLPRVVGPTEARIVGIDVPVGTVVSIGSTFVHYNPTLFPNANIFYPERWLQPNAKDLESFLVPFSKGPRSCPGVNLAWGELYLIFANIFRRLDMEIHNTSADDLKPRAYFLPVFRGRPLHCRVRERLL